MMLSTLLFLSLNFFNLSYATPETIQFKNSLNLLIVGNSITTSVPNQGIDWYGDWGMAASSSDKDYVSILESKLECENKYSKISIYRKNFSFWEDNFHYDLSQYSDISNIEYDIIIVRLGDNVDEASKQFSEYEQELTKMINYYKRKNTKVIITGTVWNSLPKDAIHQKVARNNNYSYISLLEFQHDDSNFATGKFANAGVSAHPSDKGMAVIAELLYKQIIAFY